MNKEEFKVKILNQFKTKASPIHYLMLHQKCPSLCLPRTTFAADRVFMSEEHRVVVAVESIMKDDELSFQVMFSDIEEGKGAMEEAKECWFDIQGAQFTLDAFYCQEVMLVDKHELIFRLSESTMSQSDYEYSLYSKQDKNEIRFNIKSRRFDNEKKVESFLKILRRERYRQEDEMGYCDYYLTESDKSRLAIAFTMHETSAKEKRPSIAFETAINKHQEAHESFVLRFVEELNQLHKNY